MRTRVTLAIAICAFAAGWSATANAEYFNRYNAGSWTNAEYNDGTCHYFYSVNRDTGESHVNRYGNCSHVAIGPDGRAMRVVPMAQAPVLQPRY